MNKIENIDFSDIGYGNQEFTGNDSSQEKSFLQQLRNENGSNNNTMAFHSNVGQSSSPFAGYLSEKGYISQYSTGGKNVKLNIADLSSQQYYAQQNNGQKLQNHSRYGSSIEPTQTASSSLNNTLKTVPKNPASAQVDPRNISQNNYRNLKNSAMSNSPISPTK
jgi:hypothetical protein